MQREPIRPLIFAAALLCLQTAAHSQDTYEPLKAELVKVTRPICDRMAPKFLESKEVKPMTELRAISPDAICTCAQNRFQQDPQLDQILHRPHKEVAALAKTDKFKSYVSMRFMAATLECTAKEFTATLQAADLTK